MATKIHVGRVLPPTNERISSAWSSSTTNPAIRLWLEPRHTSAACSSHRATVFQAIPSTRAIAIRKDVARLDRYRWDAHCRSLYQTPIAA